LVPAQHGYDPYCDVKFEPSAEDLKRWGSTPPPDWPWNHVRGQRGSDTFYSFYVGKLDKRGQEIYLDNDWAWVLGAVDFIKGQGRTLAATGRPLCIFLPLGYPHPPYAAEEPYYSAIDRSKLPPRIPAPASEGWHGKPSMLKGIHSLQNMQGWSEDRWTELRATYYAQCARVDDQFGRVVRALRHAGLYDDTAIFFFADHGDFTGDYGLVEKTQNTFEDCLSAVPFVVKPPKTAVASAGPTTAHGVSDALVELIDFTATAYDFAAVNPGYDHFGRSLLPLLRGQTTDHRDAVFCEGGRLQNELHCREHESRSATDPDMPYWPRMVQQHSQGPEHTKATMCRTRDFKYVQRLYESDELYDLRQDPRELCNLIADPAYTAVLSRLRDRLLTWYQQTCDAVPHDLDAR
jgi:arylsulfatase A-like enzyme